ADPEPFVNEFAPVDNSEASSSGEINIPVPMFIWFAVISVCNPVFKMRKARRQKDGCS
ncbi:hypothetical protein Tco_1536847, partial [Tanacetum coccineum]